MAQVDLTGATSVEEVVDRLVIFTSPNSGQWLIASGWDQGLFPSKKVLFLSLDPDMLLTQRVSHALRPR